MASTTNAHWLLNCSPLGWIDKLQPLYGSRPLWLVPIACLTVVLSALTIFLAGRRDLDAGIIADTDSAKPHTALLGTPLAAAFRLSRTASISWTVTIAAFALFFGLLTKSATQAFSQSSGLQHRISGVISTSQAFTVTTFLGVIFFLLMPLLMAYAASAIGHVREDEAEGYLDNFLVRPVGRQQWLWGRIALVMLITVVAALLSGICVWIGTRNQQSGVAFHTLFVAGVNIIAPAVFTLAVGVFAIGVLPRLTTLLAYSVIAWSFLIEIVSSGLHLNHWALDTSVLHHVALAPASNPNWQSTGVLLAISAVLLVLGATAFNARDLQGE